MQTEETPQEAFCRLYAKTCPEVLRYLRRRCGPEAAEDLANEVYLVAWRRWKDLPRRRELPWLYGVARNLLLERTRGMRQDDALLEEFASQALVRRDVAESVVSADAVRRVLADLTPKEREIVLLWAWEGLTAAELGRVLGCTAATAAVRLHRARRRFRAQYSVEGHDSTTDVPVRTGPRKAVSTDETF